MDLQAFYSSVLASHEQNETGERRRVRFRVAEPQQRRNIRSHRPSKERVPETSRSKLESRSAIESSSNTTLLLGRGFPDDDQPNDADANPDGHSGQNIASNYHQDEQAKTILGCHAV